MKAKAASVVQGAFVCQGSEIVVETGTPPAATSTNPGSIPDNSPPSDSGLSTGAKIGIGVAIPLVLIIVVLIVFAWRRGYKLSVRTAKRLPAGPPHPREAELPLGGHHEKTELPATEEPSELSSASPGLVPEVHELFAGDTEDAAR